MLGGRDVDWSRVVMNERIERYVSSLNIARMDALEISGNKWNNVPFRSYRSVAYSEYDVCHQPLAPETWDIIFLEQVLEHVRAPRDACRHVWQMLRPGGTFVVSTPFLIRVHDYPIDCSRWTEMGMRYLLADAGFPVPAIQVESWGNLACTINNLLFVGERYLSRVHSLSNDPRYPLMVWAFAQKGAMEST